MKLLKLKQNTPQWLEWRKRKITGTKGDMAPLRGNVPKKAFFEYVAERTFTEPVDETDIERGNRLEPIAKELIAKELGKNLTDDYVIEGDNNTGLSPDALISDSEEPTIADITEATEIKSLNNANHAELLYINKAYSDGKKLYPRSSFLTNYGIPSTYHMQVYSYFWQLANLQTLYFCAYNENAPIGRKLVILPVKRSDIADELEQNGERLKEMINEAKDFIEWLEF
jgi:hypothetical protein